MKKTMILIATSILGALGVAACGLYGAFGMQHNQITEVAAVASPTTEKTGAMDIYDDYFKSNAVAIHLWSVTFVEYSGYTSISQISEGTSWTVNADGGFIDIDLTDVSLSGTYHYTLTLPWYIKSATFKFHNGDSYSDYASDKNGTWNNTGITYSVGEWYKYYIRNSGGVGAEKQDYNANCTSSINHVSLIEKSGDTQLVDTDHLVKTYITAPVTTSLSSPLIVDSWYTDQTLATAFSSHVITETETVYVKSIVTSASFTSWINSQASGDAQGMTDSATCSSQYSLAKGYVINKMSSTERNTFQTSTDSTVVSARTRYENWARANADSSAYSGEVPNGAGTTLSFSDDNAGPIFVSVFSVLGLTTAIGYILIARRKKSV